MFFLGLNNSYSQSLPLGISTLKTRGWERGGGIRHHNLLSFSLVTNYPTGYSEAYKDVELIDDKQYYVNLMLNKLQTVLKSTYKLINFCVSIRFTLLVM